jgi:hypothetical protein
MASVINVFLALPLVVVAVYAFWLLVDYVVSHYLGGQHD